MIRLSFLLLLLAVPAFPGNGPVLTVLFTGDTGGRLKPGYGDLGGIARRARLIERIRNENRHVLTVDIGDFLSPDYLAVKSMGQLQVDLLRNMGYDIVTPGNHEFDYGMEVLEERITSLAGSGTQVTSCNILDKDGQPYVYPFVIRQAGPTGRKICFIGMMDPHASLPAARGAVRLTDAAGGIRAVMDSLAGQNIDFVVGLCHMRRTDALRLAEQVPFVDLFICLGEGPAARQIKSVEFTDLTGGRRQTIVNVSRSGLYLGRADIALDGSKDLDVTALPLEPDLPQDPVVAQQVFIEDNMANYTIFQLDSAANCADSLAGLFLRILKDRTRSEVAVLNHGMFNPRAMPVPDGRLRFNDLYEFVWVSDALVRLKLPGKKIKELAKQGAAAAGSARLYVDGVDLATGCINGKMIYDNDLYSVVTNDYLAGGGDGYGIFPAAGKNRQVRFTEKGRHLAGSVKGREYELRNDILIPELIRHRTTAAVRVADPGERPLWKFQIDALGGAVNQSWWNTQTASYTSRPNFPYQGLLHIDAAGRFSLVRVGRVGSWKNEVYAGFGKQRYEGVDLYETPNDLVAVSRYEFQKMLHRPRIFQTFYPFLQLKMDSEVTDGPDSLRQLDGFADLGLGLSLYDLKDLRVSVGAVRDLAVDSSRTAVSFGIYGKYRHEFKKPFRFDLTDRLVYEAKLGVDDNDDHRLYLYTALDIPLVTNLAVRSQVNWYNYWTRQVDKWAMAADYKISLNYTLNFKVQAF